MNNEIYGSAAFCMACFAFVVALGAWSKATKLEAQLKKERSGFTAAVDPEVAAKKKKASALGILIGFSIAVGVLVAAFIHARSK